jgi:hypothetical protein
LLAGNYCKTGFFSPQASVNEIVSVNEKGSAKSAQPKDEIVWSVKLKLGESAAFMLLARELWERGVMPTPTKSDLLRFSLIKFYREYYEMKSRFEEKEKSQNSIGLFQKPRQRCITHGLFSGYASQDY